MYVKLKGKIVENICDLASTLRDEAILEFKEDGLYMQIKDPASVSLIQMKLAKEKFIQYDTNLKEIGLDLDVMRDILRSCSDPQKQPDWISIESFEPKDNGFDLEVCASLPESRVGTTFARFKMRSIDGEPKYKLLNIPYDATVDCTSGDLYRAYRPLEAYSDHVTICIVDSEQVELSARNDERAASVIFGRIKNRVRDGNGKSMFPIDYFGNLIRAFRCVDSMEMRIGHDLPVRMTGITKEGLDVTVYIAPRVGTEG